ncbi:hypothetical protein HZI73_03310 [Vallitalea pronyensis]|uniref:Uncharacterized protein n=1 Tax=Vallitalea pronyensis TaxID=1348613 RepID=A0A8J8SFA4_9FIRM|nr:hypothetical protein [Vallitalea pronyensis]QUI21371.1 hypothetical protein HZI73_03310 [Vallitalea pronyensis]
MLNSEDFPIGIKKHYGFIYRNAHAMFSNIQLWLPQEMDYMSMYMLVYIGYSGFLV